MCPTYTYTCAICESATEEFYKYAERPETIKCLCGGTASHTITATGLVMKEAFLDGTKRKGWEDLKEASRLNKEIGKQNNEEDKKKIASQIKRLGVQVRE